MYTKENIACAYISLSRCHWVARLLHQHSRPTDVHTWVCRLGLFKWKDHDLCPWYFFELNSFACQGMTETWKSKWNKLKQTMGKNTRYWVCAFAPFVSKCLQNVRKLECFYFFSRAGGSTLYTEPTLVEAAKVQKFEIWNYVGMRSKRAKCVLAFFTWTLFQHNKECMSFVDIE